ncbi:MAG: endonuclease V [Ilumatobacter sp.]|uniref:endonuclease V n=1 Tax=Ilumatobacter sp. TaxID=1967498 RepID=UPI002606680C|nr:endonuclease V [Ilumatobacter sp.]MDJ0769174.1 endonuclease V [Ilumatobacter sp.]
MATASHDPSGTGFTGLSGEALVEVQRRIAALSPPAWHPAGRLLVVGGVFVAFARGQQGPGQAGDRAKVGAAATRGTIELAHVVADGVAGASYRPGYLAAREGAMIVTAARSLIALMDRLDEPIDVLLVDATGRDHERRCGLAVHAGAVLGVPTVGVTHRPLLAIGSDPDDAAGATSDLTLDGEVVGRWYRAVRGVRPVAVHAGWRTDVDTAVDVVAQVTGRARTPEPLRLARTAARVARAERG